MPNPKEHSTEIYDMITGRTDETPESVDARERLREMMPPRRGSIIPTPDCPKCGGTHIGSRSGHCTFDDLLPCVICSDKTAYACSDCRIQTQQTVSVCHRTECRDTHETATHPVPVEAQGEWVVCKDVINIGDVCIVSNDIDDAIIASVGMDMPEAEANARLMAAAPDLLAALRLALTRLAHQGCGVVRPTEEWIEHGSMSFDNCSCEIAIVRAAITKATRAPLKEKQG